MANMPPTQAAQSEEVKITDHDLDILIKYLPVPNALEGGDNPHLSLEEWDSLLHNTANGDDLTAIQLHLQTCTECRLTLKDAEAYEAEYSAEIASKAQ